MFPSLESGGNVKGKGAEGGWSISIDSPFSPLGVTPTRGANGCGLMIFEPFSLLGGWSIACIDDDEGGRGAGEIEGRGGAVGGLGRTGDVDTIRGRIVDADVDVAVDAEGSGGVIFDPPNVELAAVTAGDDVAE